MTKLYLGNSKGFRIVSEVNKFTVTQLSIKSTCRNPWHFYTQRIKEKRDINNIQFTIAPQKYFGIRISKEVKDLCEENYK